MNRLILLGAVLALLLVVGALIGASDRARFVPRWLLVAALLVAVNDALLTRLYGVIPKLLPAADWNWQGKAMALAATLLIAALPAFGWRRVGLTLAQAPGSLRTAVPVLLLYIGFFVVLGVIFPKGDVDAERVAFQLTMPGLEEEPFYRGVLLFALDRAFTGRVRWLGVDWGWGAVLSSMMFGLAHALSFGNDGFAFEPLVMALTALPSFGAVWLRLRTRSLLLPVLMHNAGNAVPLIV